MLTRIVEEAMKKWKGVKKTMTRYLGIAGDDGMLYFLSSFEGILVGITCLHHLKSYVRFVPVVIDNHPAT